MSEFRLCNAWIKQIAIVEQDLLNRACYAGLYQNNPTISSALLKTDLIPCTFAGYAPQVLNGLIPRPIKADDGWYVINGPSLTFTSLDATPQNIIGWYVYYNIDLQFVCKLTTPFPISVGVPFSFRFQLNEMSIQVACP